MANNLGVTVWVLLTELENVGSSIEVHESPASADKAAAECVASIIADAEGYPDVTADNWSDLLEQYRAAHDCGDECYVEDHYVPGIGDNLAAAAGALLAEIDNAKLDRLHPICVMAEHVRTELARDPETAASIAALKNGAMFDHEAEADGWAWRWYILDPEDSDRQHDSRAVQRKGEWRVYFQTALELCAECDIEIARPSADAQ